jgi:hypothetical protein
MILWLVVTGTCFIFPLGRIIIPTDELHHFSEGLVETTNQMPLKFPLDPINPS